MLVPIIGIGVAFILMTALTICVLWMIYQVIHYNMIKDELPYFDQQTRKFLFDTIRKKVETQYGYEMKAALSDNAFYIDNRLFYTFDRLTYNNFFDFLKKRKMSFAGEYHFIMPSNINFSFKKIKFFSVFLSFFSKK